MSIQIIKSGIFTTIQDLGRFGYRRYGVNPGGVMDRAAARLINILLGNDENEAVLEMHFPAAQILFEQDMVIALGGANFSARLDDVPAENWRPMTVRRGSILQFVDKTFGSRLYLSVKGGLAIEEWLGSASTNLKAQIGGYAGRCLQNGDRIGTKNSHSPPKSPTFRLAPSILPFYSRFPTVRAVAGPEFELLTAFSQETFLKENFKISPNSDRMGFRLAGQPLYLLHEKEMVSSAVNFGTIQLLPEGQLIVLMADHQTSGGYPRLGTVISADLPLLAQLGPGDKVGFELVPLDEAENLIADLERDLVLLRTGCAFKWS